MSKEEYEWSLTLSRKQMIKIERQVERRLRERWGFLREYLRKNRAKA